MMQYTSTRDDTLRVSAAQAIVTGLAPDGGLFVPMEFPRLTVEDVRGKTYARTARLVLERFLGEYSGEFLDEATRAAYDGTRWEDALGRTVPVTGDGLYALELWHGPTSAFKDYALQLMPRLLVEGKRLLGRKETTEILVATSGDTGKAALEGYRDLPGIKIAVFYPNDGTSEIQRLQMATQQGDNVAVFAVDGNFDDAQTGVKRVFSDPAVAQALAQRGTVLSSANSINWGRLVPQIVYYYFSYVQLLEAGHIAEGEAVDFCVPTGNFGDILAGWYAKQMGLPVGRLICASNSNNVLTDFLDSGDYDARRAFHKTTSPSMDILVSSNLERLLYHTTGDASQVAAWMSGLNADRRYRIPVSALQRLTEDFSAGWAGDEQAAKTIRLFFEQHGYLMDPHTAVAFHAAQRKRTPGRACVVLSTASPYKFPAVVLGALGQDVPAGEFDALHRLEQYTGIPAPANLAALQGRPVRFARVIPKGGIGEAALSV